MYTLDMYTAAAVLRVPSLHIGSGANGDLDSQ